MTTPPHTGSTRLDQALAGLAELGQHPVAEQYAHLNRAQEQLRAALNDPDQNEMEHDEHEHDEHEQDEEPADE